MIVEKLKNIFKTNMTKEKIVKMSNEASKETRNICGYIFSKDFDNYPKTRIFFELGSNKSGNRKKLMHLDKTTNDPFFMLDGKEKIKWEDMVDFMMSLAKD